MRQLSALRVLPSYLRIRPRKRTLFTATRTNASWPFTKESGSKSLKAATNRFPKNGEFYFTRSAEIELPIDNWWCLNGNSSGIFGFKK